MKRFEQGRAERAELGVTVRHGQTGLWVPTRDVDALADALAYLLTHPAQAQEMGRTAQKHIQQLTWQRTSEIYRDVFAKLI